MKIYLLCVIDKVLCFPRKSAATGVWVKAFHLHQTLKTKKSTRNECSLSPVGNTFGDELNSEIQDLMIHPPISTRSAPWPL